jgi:DNA mismatch endonuclease, patch repair protein
MPESWASSEHARLTMRANRARDTAPERAIRSILHARGYRYRTHYQPVAGLRRTADIVFTRLKVVIFVDGCFWHGCPQHFIAPKTNSAYWGSKIEGNIARDRATDRALREAGWTVLRFWEHQAPIDVADRIERQLAELRGTIQ